jgi:hypothetical protein
LEVRAVLPLYFVSANDPILVYACVGLGVRDLGYWGSGPLSLLCKCIHNYIKIPYIVIVYRSQKDCTTLAYI